jgi:putative transposase
MTACENAYPVRAAGGQGGTRVIDRRGEHRTYVFRLYPTKVQAETLNLHLAEACRLYNAALQERRDAYRIARKNVTYVDQSRQLKEIRASGDIEIASFNVAEEVLKRVDRAFRAFFRRVQNRHGRAGFPRFRSARRYDSLTYRIYGNGIKRHGKGVLYARGVGAIKFKEHRPIQGDIRTVTIKRAEGRWFVYFVSDQCSIASLPPSDTATGIDVGLTSFVTFSDGTAVDNPRHFRDAEGQLRRAHRRVARRKRGSTRRMKAVEFLSRACGTVRRRRADFHHKLSRRIVNEFGLIAVENLNVRGLARSALSKSVHDAGWSLFIDKLTYKAASAGRVLVKVDPSGTSQTCPCGAVVSKTLSQRRHDCPECGLSAPRDHVSAQIILGRGLRLQVPTWADTPSVA